jgi:hypothetical protein
MLTLRLGWEAEPKGTEAKRKKGKKKAHNYYVRFL